MFDLDALRNPAQGPKKGRKFWLDDATQARLQRCANYARLDMSDVLTRLIHTYLPEDPGAKQTEEFRLDDA